MAGNTIGNVSTLQYQQQAEILSPVEVTITDGVLRWTVDFTAHGHGIDRKCFRLTPVTGALKDFLKLTDGEPESVQEFVLQRGVLGIAPHLDLVTWDGHKGTHTLSYREPIGVYQYLACNATNTDRDNAIDQRGNADHSKGCQHVVDGRNME